MTNEKLDLFNALQRFSSAMTEKDAIFCFTLSEGTDGQILHFGGNEDLLMTGLAGIENPTEEVKAMMALVCIMATSIATYHPEFGKMLVEDIAEVMKVS